MANMAAKIFAASLDEHGVKYQYANDEESVMHVGWKVEGTNLDLFFKFYDDNEDVQVFGRFVNVPEDKTEKMYKACNECNCRFRWAKFTVVDGKISVESDAIIQLDSCAEEVTGYMVRLTKIVEAAYPVFMKAMWA